MNNEEYEKQFKELYEEYIRDGLNSAQAREKAIETLRCLGFTKEVRSV